MNQNKVDFIDETRDIKDVNEIGQFIPLHYHFQMMSDTIRTNAFRTAIEEVVKPHHKVAELGSGSGILTFFAAKQGARVWSVEYNPAMVTASQKFIHDNGLSERVTITQGDAFTWLPPEPVDIVICEMLHSALLREKQLEVITNFRNAHLARFGKIPRLLPNATLLGVQPVWQEYDFGGFYAPIPLFQSAYEKNEDCISDGGPVVYKIIDYDKSIMATFDSEVFFHFQQDIKVNSLRFITKSLLTINLTTGQTVDWNSQNLILPLRETMEIKAGQTLRLNFSYKPGDSIEVLQNSIEAEIVEIDLARHQETQSA